MQANDQKILQRVADTIRILSAEGVEAANSGHPGLPMGCAEIGAVLYGRVLRHNPKNPAWIGRDRFVLSAGHGSMWLYTMLHLSGYDVTIEDLKSFRQLHSRTPGHPEIGETPGVETTTGPLGQGVGHGLGMAIAQKWLGARFGAEMFGRVYVLAGDGDMMEGISAESASLAGHLGLNNLIVTYDSNGICLDGPVKECFTENVAGRYEAYGWNVLQIDGHDLAAIEEAYAQAAAEQFRPTLIVARTTIGKGSPGRAGTSKVHGSPLGADEMKATRAALGWPDEPFHVPAEVREYFAKRQATFAGHEAEWNGKLAELKKDAAKGAQWEQFVARQLPADFAEKLWAMEIEPNKATRTTSQKVMNKVAEMLPFFLVGSADLSCSDMVEIKGGGNISGHNWDGRNVKFGVREFAMAAACNGMSAFGMIRPLCGTFFTFSDYMRNAIRITSIMKQRVIYQFTHDSIFLGEDGPTHQPVEHLASLRAMPGLTLFRPADENELKAAWIEAFKTDGPVALVLTRQNIKSQGEATATRAREGVARGAYVLREAADADATLIATGSEVGLAMSAAALLEERGRKVRVVSMPCWERFEAQHEGYRAEVLGGAGLRVSIEAGVSMGWHKWVGAEGLTIAVDRFGASAPIKELAEEFGFTPEKVAARVEEALAKVAAPAV